MKRGSRDIMRTVVIDEEGYLKLPEEIIEKYGGEFELVELEKVIYLKSIEFER